LIGLVILGPALFFWLRLRLERNQKVKGETQHGK
jgi:heme A synthase